MINVDDQPGRESHKFCPPNRIIGTALQQNRFASGIPRTPLLARCGMGLWPI